MGQTRDRSAPATAHHHRGITVAPRREVACILECCSLKKYKPLLYNVKASGDRCRAREAAQATIPQDRVSPPGLFEPYWQ